MNRLKELRKSRGFTLEKISKSLQISQSTLSNWENGRREPDIQSLITLADYYKVPIDFLVDRDYREEFINNKEYVLKKEQIIPLIEKIAKIDEKYYPNIDDYIRGIIDAQNTNTKNKKS